MDYDTQRRIEDLELRLAKYHAHLETAIAQRDRLAMDTAWGVQQSLYTLTGVGLFIFLYKQYFDGYGWIIDFLVGIGYLAICIGVSGWLNKIRASEVERLSKLPDWDLKLS
jgi:hypothetical protein